MQLDPLRRREFITLVSGAVAWPLAARGQQAALPVIGFLAIASRDTFGYLIDAFRLGLKDVGHVEGKNVEIEYRWADNQIDRLPALAADLVRRQVAVIAAVGGLAAPRAAKAATTTIPIVFTLGGDPVRLGLVDGLSRPGGNVTGMSVFSGTLLAERLQVARELLPADALLAALMNPANPENDSDTKDLRRRCAHNRPATRYRERIRRQRASLRPLNPQSNNRQGCFSLGAMCFTMVGATRLSPSQLGRAGS